ncbi:MAG: twin-arginine translocation signal domain-containing protein, partial [Acetobacteraceae bacterium]
MSRGMSRARYHLSAVTTMTPTSPGRVVTMPITRRHVLAGSAAGAAALTTGLARPALAANEPFRIGFLPALTGPSSSTGVAMNRGTLL